MDILRIFMELALLHLLHIFAVLDFIIRRQKENVYCLIFKVALIQIWIRMVGVTVRL
jgi:hypothetical protein